jgi:hypothetical protein
MEKEAKLEEVKRNLDEMKNTFSELQDVEIAISSRLFDLQQSIDMLYARQQYIVDKIDAVQQS